MVFDEERTVLRAEALFYTQLIFQQKTSRQEITLDGLFSIYYFLINSNSTGIEASTASPLSD